MFFTKVIIFVFVLNIYKFLYYFIRITKCLLSFVNIFILKLEAEFYM